MAGFDLMEGMRKAFLAGVGAVATGAEKSQEIVGDLIEKGELTVEQGKALNAELTRKAREAFSDADDSILRTRMGAMTPEERAAYAARVTKMAADLDAETVEVEGEAVADEADEPQSEESAE